MFNYQTVNHRVHLIRPVWPPRIRAVEITACNDHLQTVFNLVLPLVGEVDPTNEVFGNEVGGGEGLECCARLSLGADEEEGGDGFYDEAVRRHR